MYRLLKRFTLYICQAMFGKAAVLKISKNFQKNIFSRVPFKQFELPNLPITIIIGGGLLIYIRDYISTKLLKHDLVTNIENLSIEINLRKKWLFSSSYSPRKNKTSHHLNYLNLVCSEYSKNYDYFIFVGDFNANE